MQLNEGPILISDEDRNIISKYIKDMKSKVDALLKRKRGIRERDLCTIFQKISDASKYNLFPFEIRYEYEQFGGMSACYYKSTNTVYMNLAYIVDIKSSDDDPYWGLPVVESVNFKKFTELFAHEFIHYIQHVRRQEKSGEYEIPDTWNDRDKYWKRPWEQQAHAIEYLEKLKHDLKIKKPGEILSQLKKMGVLHRVDLDQLKKSDYKSWKAIMKQAIMTALADMEGDESLPWQKRKLP
jgi:hypothetical protein